MKVAQQSTTDGTDSGGGSAEHSGQVLEITPNDLRGGWEVVAAGSHNPLYFEREIWDASDRAIDHLSENGGGEVLEWSRDGRIIGRQSVSKVLSREGILQRGQEICAAESMPLIQSSSAVDFDVPCDELEFAAALWHVCNESRGTAWKETDLGFAFQYGPYVLLNRDSGRYALEQCDGTAAAMRRFDEVGCDELAITETGLLVVEELKVTNYDGGEFTLQPGEFLEYGSATKNYAVFSPGWVEVVDLTKEQLERLRPVCVVKRDLEFFFISEADAVIFEQLTGKKFLKS
jgi:hypothetical protein